MPTLTVTWTEDPRADPTEEVEYMVFDKKLFGGPCDPIVEGKTTLKSPLTLILPDEVPPVLTLVLLSPDNAFWRQDEIEVVSGEDKTHHIGPLCPERRYVT